MKVRVAVAVIFLMALSYVPPAGAQRYHQTKVGPVEILHVRGLIYMLIGAGANVTASVGPDGTLLVDTGSAEMSEELLAAIRHLQEQLAPREEPPRFGAETRSEFQALRTPPAPPKPIRFVVNTHVHDDHVGGNATIAAAGRTITGGNVAGDLSNAMQAASILSHESVLHTLAKREPALASHALPTDTYFTPYFKLGSHFNGEGVQLIHQPAAHTSGDTLVWFRGSDVIATGDLFVLDAYPRFDPEEGGSIDGVVDGLNAILDLAFPEFRLEGGTLIVPGHGRLADSSDVAYYRDMVTVIRDRVRQMVEKGASLDEVKKARPTLDYDPRFGSDSGPWTTDMFVTAVYRSLSENKAR